MNTRSLILRLILILVVLAVAAFSIYPPEKSFRLGKDLRGGVSLVYEVQLAPEDDASETIDALIDALKKRVDPESQLDISIVRQGRDRLEITMPLPSERVKSLHAAYDAALAELDEAALSEEEFEELMRRPPSERETWIVAHGGSPEGEKKLRDAAAALDRARQSRADLRAAQAPGPGGEAAPPERIAELVEATGEAEAEYERLRAEVLADALSSSDLRDALLLSRLKVRKIDKATDEVVELLGPRDVALARILGDHPGAAPQIQRVLDAHAAYEENRKSLDDAEDLIRLLRGAGVLEFRITVNPDRHPEEARLRREVQEVGPKNVKASDVVWCKINKVENWFDSKQAGEDLIANPQAYFRSFGGIGYVVEEYNGEYYMLCWDIPGSRLVQEPGSNWSVSDAGRTVDELGRPAISFEMNVEGASMLGDLTGAHRGEQMAVLMDDQVYTAPVLQDRISNSGRISGDFSQEELNYIIRTLRAGSLAAKLSPEPISRVTLAPDLGQDNLNRALYAGFISMGICAAFLVSYYFGCGLIAVVGLAVNATLLVGIMALNEWAFTLPGIAGVILTFAMAVDANVLVYERIREELTRGEDLRTAVRLGYQRALSAIVDGNLTNLIVCTVLIKVGTQEVKGFAITMSIGVLTTLFAQLFVTRVIFGWLVDVLGWSRARMLPLVVPAVQRAFQFNVDWMRLRYLFFAITAALVVLSVGVTVYLGGEMFDTEFRGGTSVTIQLKKNEDGTPLKVKRQDVEDRVEAAAAEVGDEQARAQLARASVQVMNPEADGVTSDRFVIKTLVTDGALLESVIGRAFIDWIESQPPIEFRGWETAHGGDPAAPTRAVTNPELGNNIDRPLANQSVRDFLGGLAIVLEDIHTPPDPSGRPGAVTAESLQQRLDKVRADPQPDLPDISGRRTRVVVLDGSEQDVKSAVVLVSDPDVSFFISQSAWEDMRDAEWTLLTRALTQQDTRLMSVQEFSPAIARTFVAQAVVAFVLSVILVVIYVWVRFNSVRYSIAAVLPTLHDCFVTVGLLAFADLICYHAPTVADAIGLMPFKIDLTVVAAVLTVLGYSINDKIVVLDRIRENRGKLTYASRKVINDSVNQTMSRTIMTGSTTILSTIVLYVFGGEAVRAFSFALGTGVIIGTFTSVALGAPLVWSPKLDRARTDASPAA